jgi:hypothetical protein
MEISKFYTFVFRRYVRRLESLPRVLIICLKDLLALLFDSQFFFNMKSPRKSPSKVRRQSLDSHLPFLPLCSSLTIEYSKYVIQPRPWQTALAQLVRGGTPTQIPIVNPVVNPVVDLVLLKRRLHLHLLLQRPLLKPCKTSKMPPKKRPQTKTFLAITALPHRELRRQHPPQALRRLTQHPRPELRRVVVHLQARRRLTQHPRPELRRVVIHLQALRRLTPQEVRWMEAVQRGAEWTLTLSTIPMPLTWSVRTITHQSRSSPFYHQLTDRILKSPQPCRRS